MTDRRRRWIHRGIGLLLALASFVLVIRNQHDVGLARDETTYMATGSRYADWWLDLVTGKDGTVSEKSITSHFGGKPGGPNNAEHPPLVKTLMGLSERVFHDKLDLTDEITAYRIPVAALNALLVYVVFAWTLALWGLAEAILAALLVTFLPRAFFHAGLGTFDAPIATLWVTTVYAYWRALASRRWAWIAGACFGLALATKHNALLLPFALLLHYVWVSVRKHRLSPAPPLDPPAPRAWPRIRHAALVVGRKLGVRPSLFLSFAVIAPLVLVALWPWLWFDPLTITCPPPTGDCKLAGHAGDWINFHLHHVHYNFEYLGHNWNAPPFPWHVALVTTLFTVPVATLASAGLGIGVLVARARRRVSADAERAPGLLLFLSALASMGPFVLGSTPIFGAEKHWMPAIPSLCVAAGVGAVWAARTAVARLAERVPAIAAHRTRACVAGIVTMSAFVTLAAATETFQAQPYALSSYNALAGGAPGGADLGMNRQFWGYSAAGALPYLRAHAPKPGEPNAPVYSHDASMAWPTWQRLGLVPRTMPDAGHETGGVRTSKWAIVVHELHFNRHDYLIWDAYGTVQPVFVLRKDGVPIVSVYRRR